MTCNLLFGKDVCQRKALLAEIERLRALLDITRIWMKNRDRSEREQVLYDEIRRALDGEKG